MRTFLFFSVSVFFVVSILATNVSPLCAQPILGYVYPAGVQRGETTRIIVCGRNLNGASEVVVSGIGVTAKVLQQNLQLRSNNGDDTIVLRRMLMESRKKLEGEKDPTVYITQVPGYNPNNVTTLPSDEQLKNRYVYFKELEKPTPELIQMVYYEYFGGGPERRVVDSLRNVVYVEVTADKTATPGDRHLRLRTSAGLSTPIRFVVGPHKEVSELEPNDTEPNSTETNTFFWNTKWKMVSLPPQEVPITFNGRIRAGDVDRLSFTAKKGQRLTILGRARHLVPFLADAVPGWFELHITILDEKGNKVDIPSPKQYDPDPVLFFTVPANGTYTAVVQDSIFRGRDDFIYRISVDTSPYITGMFPLGRPAMGNEPEDTPVETELYGWLSPTRKIPLPPQITTPNVAASVIPYGTVGEIPSVHGRWLPTPLPIGYSFLPECFETTSTISDTVSDNDVGNEVGNGVGNEKRTISGNSVRKTAVSIVLPVVMNGRIDTKNEVDTYTFSGKKGQTIVCDLVARSLGGMLDASLQLCDSVGKVVAQNDDRADSSGPNIGLCTHHVDPYLMTELPADGEYTVRVYSTLNHFGNEYGYRLRVSEPMPDFTVFAGPSGLYLPSNVSQTITATVIRHDGFDGEIKLWVKSVGGNPSGAVTTRNGTVPKNAKTHTFTVAADRTYTGNVIPLRLEATAQVGKVTISHEVVPVDNAEQAFIYKHLLPTETFLMSGRK